MEQLNYNLLFRWFVGMNMDEQVWVATVFTKNRDRLLKHSIAESFFQRVLKVAQPYLSDEYFTVDGTPIDRGIFTCPRFALEFAEPAFDLVQPR